jgi:hypothetical protein
MHQDRLPLGPKQQVSAVHPARLVGVGGFTTSVLLGSLSAPPSVSADRCADVEVLFARGTGEPPGVGAVGQAFIDSLRLKVGGKSFGVSGVNYPTTIDFPTALDGIDDAGHHIEHRSATPRWCSADFPQARLSSVLSPRLHYRREHITQKTLLTVN